MGEVLQDHTLISEKEDLVHVLMLFANGTDPCLTPTDYSTNVRSQNPEESLYVLFNIVNMYKC